MGTQRGGQKIVFCLKRVANRCIKYIIKGEQHDIMYLSAQSDQSSLSIKQSKQKTLNHSLSSDHLVKILILLQ